MNERMKVHIKKTWPWILIAAITTGIIIKYNLTRIWGIYIVLMLLAAVIIMNKLFDNILDDTDRNHLKKSLGLAWLIIICFSVNLPSEEAIKYYGRNSLGIAEPIWIIIVWALAGIVLYVLFISDVTFSLKDGKLTIEKCKRAEKAAEHGLDIIETIVSFNKNYHSLLEYTIARAYAFREDVDSRANYIAALNDIMLNYLRTQDYFSEFEIIGLEDIEKYQFDEYTGIRKGLKRIECQSAVKHGIAYVMIPFLSELNELIDGEYDTDPLIIVLASHGELIGIEHDNILYLLKVFDAIILA